MIEKLTKKKLVEYHFNQYAIEKLLSNKEKLVNHNAEGLIIADSIEMKIYTGVDAYKKYNFPNGIVNKFPYGAIDLLDKYYDFRITEYLNNHNTIYKSKNSINEIENEFIKFEIENISTQIEALKSENSKNSLKQIESQRHYLSWLKQLQNSKEKNSTLKWDELIKPEFQNHFLALEEKILHKIDDWKAGKDKIGCAAFCQLLFEKKYFIAKSLARKTPNEFAIIRYKNDINVQLNSSNKKDREHHKNYFKRHFI